MKFLKQFPTWVWFFIVAVAIAAAIWFAGDLASSRVNKLDGRRQEAGLQVDASKAEVEKARRVAEALSESNALLIKEQAAADDRSWRQIETSRARERDLLKQIEALKSKAAVDREIVHNESDESLAKTTQDMIGHVYPEDSGGSVESANGAFTLNRPAAEAFGKSLTDVLNLRLETETTKGVVRELRVQNFSLSTLHEQGAKLNKSLQAENTALKTEVTARIEAYKDLRHYADLSEKEIVALKRQTLLMKLRTPIAFIGGALGGYYIGKKLAGN